MFPQKSIKYYVFNFGDAISDFCNFYQQVEKYLTKLGYSICNVVPGNGSFLCKNNARDERFPIDIAEPL